MKGVSVFLASTLLILMTIVASVFVSGWLSTTTSTQAETIRNQSSAKLQCQYADIYIKNATYSCGGNCTTGTQHTTTITIVNSGKKSVSADRLHIRNTTGIVTTLLFNETKALSVGDALTVSNTTRDSCSGINNSIELITVSSITCPSTAYDSIEGADVTYTSC